MIGGDGAVVQRIDPIFSAARPCPCGLMGLRLRCGRSLRTYVVWRRRTGNCLQRPKDMRGHGGRSWTWIRQTFWSSQIGNRKVVRFYNQRGEAEQWIKESKQTVKMTRLSCRRFRGNEVRLWLSILAYNLGNLWLAAPAICCRIKKMNS